MLGLLDKIVLSLRKNEYSEVKAGCAALLIARCYVVATEVQAMD